jgi:hypothetical protein
MKLRILGLLALLVSMALPARAQYPNNYAAYYTFGTDSASGNVVVNFSVTGTILPPAPNMPNAYHQAQVRTVWNSGTANWQYGQHVCPGCNVNFNGSFDFAENDLCWGLGSCTLQVESTVACSFIGAFWNGLTFNTTWFQSQKATTTWKNNSPTTQQPPFSFSIYCSARTTPPDINSYDTSIQTWQPAMATTNTFCSRLGGYGITVGWICWPVTPVAEALPATPPDCTNWDNGYPGKILKNSGGPQPMNPPKP